MRETFQWRRFHPLEKLSEPIHHPRMKESIPHSAGFLTQSRPLENSDLRYLHNVRLVAQCKRNIITSLVEGPRTC